MPAPKNCKCGCAPIHGYNHVAPIPKFKPVVRGTAAYARALDRLSKTAALKVSNGALLSFTDNPNHETMGA